MKSFLIVFAILVACAQAQFVYPNTAGTFRYATDTPTIRFRTVSVGTLPASVVACAEPTALPSGSVCTAELTCASVTAVVGSSTDYTCAIASPLTLGNLIYVINAAGQTVNAKQGDVVDSPSLVAGNALTKRAATIASVFTVSGSSLTTVASDYTSVTVTTAAGSGTYQCPVANIITTITSLGCSVPAGAFTDAQTGVVNIAASLFGKGMSATQSDSTSYVTPSIVTGSGINTATTASAADCIVDGQSLSASATDYSNVFITTSGGGVFACPVSSLSAVTTSTIGCAVPAYTFTDCQVGLASISFTLYGLNISATATDTSIIPVGSCAPNSAPRSAPVAAAPSVAAPVVAAPKATSPVAGTPKAASPVASTPASAAPTGSVPTPVAAAAPTGTAAPKSLINAPRSSATVLCFSASILFVTLAIVFTI